VSELGTWAVIVGGMLVTYLTRLSFIVLFPAERLPARVRRGLRYAPPAVLAAIILPSLLLPAGSGRIALFQPRLVAGSIAGIVAWRTRNSWLTIAVGMGLLWIARSVGFGS
jgi:branched-subunit amino acid transport protein